MKPWSTSLLLFVLATACAHTADKQPASAAAQPIQRPTSPGSQIAHFASGCFWCSEEIFHSVKGVEEVIAGYSGGTEPDPSYAEVSSGRTGHAEAVEVHYDPQVVDFATLVQVFFASQDPTTPSRQGPDAGPQYRSIAFYDTPEQQAIIAAEIRRIDASGAYDSPVVTEVVPFVEFWPAEAEHQDFVRRNPDNRYVRQVSKPRFERFREKMPEVLE